MGRQATEDAKNTARMAKIFNSKKLQTKASNYNKTATYANKKVADISSGRLKAGKDFIVQRDINFSPIPMLNMPALSLRESPVSTKSNPVYLTATNGEIFTNAMLGLVIDDKVIYKNKSK